MMLDILTVVSSDKRFPLDAAALMQAEQVRLVHTFRTGAECLRALELEEESAARGGSASVTSRVVLIDSVISDIAPVNLCDALRMRYPDMGLVLVVGKQSTDEAERAMLAGARATIARDADVSHLARVLERVRETARAQERGVHASGVQGRTASTARRVGAASLFVGRGVVVPVVGARGGAGRSTVSAALAWLAARSGVDTALVDLDLQFGDLSFLFGATSGATLYDFLQAAREGSFAAGGPACNVRRFGRELGEGLTLYVPEAVPEKAELMTGALPTALDTLRREHQLVIANTGAYWTLFHAELLEQSDLALCLFDQTVAGVRSTRLLRDLCRRLGVPPSRLLCVMNKVQDAGLRRAEVAETLQVEQVHCLTDGGRELAFLLDGGDLRGFFERGHRLLGELGLLLDEVAACTDLDLHTAVRMRSLIRRGERGERGGNTGQFRLSELLMRRSA